MSEAMQSTDAQNETTPATVLEFDNKMTGETITVEGKITERTQRHDAEWCDEWATVTNDDGKEFEIRMADTYDLRTVKCNGTMVGKWTVLLN